MREISRPPDPSVNCRLLDRPRHFPLGASLPVDLSCSAVTWHRSCKFLPGTGTVRLPIIHGSGCTGRVGLGSLV